MVDSLLDRGLNFLDTANVCSRGAERIVRQGIAGRRDA
jgi:aryl-alcohol dehydrogenase-like predicted oxidoreductase